MFKRKTEYAKSNNISPEIFIENNDYANSELLWKLDQFTGHKYFTITKHEHRIDLIAKEIYGDEKYSWILMYINRVSLNDLVRRKVLKVIPKDELTKIINSTYARNSI